MAIFVCSKRKNLIARSTRFTPHPLRRKSVMGNTCACEMQPTTPTTPTPSPPRDDTANPYSCAREHVLAGKLAHCSKEMAHIPPNDREACHVYIYIMSTICRSQGYGLSISNIAWCTHYTVDPRKHQDGSIDMIMHAYDLDIVMRVNGR